MARFMISVWHDDAYEVDFTSEEAQRLGAQVGAFNAELEETGALVFADGLEPASTATVLRPAAGEVTDTDGPYFGSTVQMGGFWVIEAPDRDAALGLARKAATACEAPVELRPFQGG